MKFPKIAETRKKSAPSKNKAPLSIITAIAAVSLWLTAGTNLLPAAFADASQSADPSQSHEKEPFKADQTPPDMVVDERTEMEMLRDLGDSLKKLEHAATETIHEVNRYAPSPVNSDDILNAAVMDPFWAQPFDPTLTASLRKGAQLPPRKKWLDFDVSQVEGVVGILQHEVSSLCPPVALSNTARDSFKVELSMMSEANGKIQSDNDQLKTLAKGPTYDSDKIGKTAHDMRIAARTIEECRKRAVKALSKK